MPLLSYAAIGQNVGIMHKALIEVYVNLWNLLTIWLHNV